MRNPALIIICLSVLAACRSEGTQAVPDLSSGYLSRAVLEQAIPLRLPADSGLSQSVTTADPEAQAYYDQGLTYLACYAWVDAARSFHESLRRDTNLAMAHVGLVKAYTGAESLADARVHLRQAIALSKVSTELTPFERKWIDLARIQFEGLTASAQDSGAHQERYRIALEDLLAQDSSDPLAWTLRGNAEEAQIGGRGQAGSASSIVFYESALRRDPDNLAAHHFLTHSYENMGEYEKAAEHARRFAEIASTISHAQHMYGHILPRLGRWEEALQLLAKADRLHRKRFQEDGLAFEHDWHFGHNLRLLGAVNARLGKEDEAERCFLEAYGLRSGRFLKVYDRVAWIEYLLLKRRFHEAEAAAARLVDDPSPADQVAGFSLRSEALLGLQQVKEATEMLTRAQAGLDALTESWSRRPEFQRVSLSLVQIFVQVLKARFSIERRSDEGDVAVLRLADRLARTNHMDGWALGLFRLERLISAAEISNREELAQELLERLRRIDPDYATSRVPAAGRASSPVRD